MKVIIPARYASTRLPGKPLKLLAGKPMLQHVYERALESQAQEIIIATDDQRVVDAAEGFGAKVCMTSDQHNSGTDRIAEVIDHYDWQDDEILVNLQGDEPLMPATLINQVATGLAEHPDAVTSTLATAVDTTQQIADENTVKVVIDEAGYALYFSRAAIPWVRGNMQWGQPVADDLQQHFLRHIGLYAYRAGFVREYIHWPVAPIEALESLEQLRILWHGKKIQVSIAAEVPPEGVDTEEDFQRMDKLLRIR